MKLSDYRLVSYVLEDVHELKQLIATAAVGVTVNGRYHDDGLIEKVKPLVIAHLQAKIDAKVEYLKSLGVTLQDEDPPKSQQPETIIPD